MRRSLTALAMSLALIGAGCSHKIYVIGANGPDHDREVPSGAAVCVAKDPKSAAQDFDEQITEKAEALVQFKGYRSVNSSDAVYFLLFDYRIKAQRTVSRIQHSSGTQSGMETVKREGPFNHALSLRLIKGDAYRDSEVEEVVWQGGAVFNDVPTHGTKFHDMLLVAAFELFPIDSKETLKLKMTRGDSRTKELRASLPADQ